MKHFVVKKGRDGLYGLVTLDDAATERNRQSAARETARAKVEPSVVRFRERRARAASGHMPFPGHRHMGEIER